MKPPKQYRTEAEVLRAVADLFDQFLEDDIEEVDAVLREFGYDPYAVAARMKAVAELALAESSLNWRTHAKEELARKRASIESSTSSVGVARDQLLEIAARLMRQAQEMHGMQAVAHFRNFEEVTDEDLAGIVDEIRYLLAKED